MASEEIEDAEVTARSAEAQLLSLIPLNPREDGPGEAPIRQAVEDLRQVRLSLPPEFRVPPAEPESFTNTYVARLAASLCGAPRSKP